MKILHVIASFDLSAGGPPRIALRLAAGAALLGHDVTTVYYDVGPDAQKALDEEWLVVPSAELLKRKVLSRAGWFERNFGLNARHELNNFIPGFDIVHTHDVWSGISRVAMSLAVKHRVAFVLLPNGMLDPWSLRQKKLKKQLLLSTGYRRVLDHALFFHAGNLEEKAGIEQLGLSRPIEIIPNGIYPQEFEPLPARGLFLAAHPKLEGKRFILFLSRLHYKKGLDYLATAFASIAPKHPDVDLVVAGPDGGAENPFREMIRQSGLESRVHIVGPTFSKDRYQSIIDCACFCLPSRQEGFSIAILEAMACGRPVVISSACHFPEVAVEGAGEVVPLKVPAIAAALDKVLSDPELAQQMGATGRKLVLERFTWTRISKLLVDCYQRHLDRR